MMGGWILALVFASVEAAWDERLVSAVEVGDFSVVDTLLRSADPPVDILAKNEDGERFCDYLNRKVEHVEPPCSSALKFNQFKIQRLVCHHTMTTAVSKMQAITRGYLTRRELIINGDAAVKIQGVYRGYAVRNAECCSVCFEKVYPTDDVIRLGCKHKFHRECIKPWVENFHYNDFGERFPNRQCPLCRKRIDSGIVSKLIGSDGLYNTFEDLLMMGVANFEELANGHNIDAIQFHAPPLPEDAAVGLLPEFRRHITFDLNDTSLNDSQFVEVIMVAMYEAFRDTQVVSNSGRFTLEVQPRPRALEHDQPSVQPAPLRALPPPTRFSVVHMDEHLSREVSRSTEDAHNLVGSFPGVARQLVRHDREAAEVAAAPSRLHAERMRSLQASTHRDTIPRMRSAGPDLRRQEMYRLANREPENTTAEFPGGHRFRQSYHEWREEILTPFQTQEEEHEESDSSMPDLISASESSEEDSPEESYEPQPSVGRADRIQELLDNLSHNTAQRGFLNIHSRASHARARAVSGHEQERFQAEQFLRRRAYAEAEDLSEVGDGTEASAYAYYSSRLNLARAHQFLALRGNRNGPVHPVVTGDDAHESPVASDLAGAHEFLGRRSNRYGRVHSAGDDALESRAASAIDHARQFLARRRTHVFPVNPVQVGDTAQETPAASVRLADHLYDYELD